MPDDFSPESLDQLLSGTLSSDDRQRNTCRTEAQFTAKRHPTQRPSPAWSASSHIVMPLLDRDPDLDLNFAVLGAHHLRTRAAAAVAGAAAIGRSLFSQPR